MAALPTVGVSPCGNHATAFSLKYVAIVAGSRVANEFDHATAACRSAAFSRGCVAVLGRVHPTSSAQTINSGTANLDSNVVLPSAPYNGLRLSCAAVVCSSQT